MNGSEISGWRKGTQTKRNHARTLTFTVLQLGTIELRVLDVA
jgi:hypothetical protein